MDRLLRRSPAPTKDAPSPTPTGEGQLLTLEGVNTSVLHEAVRNSPGELIFYTVPNAGINVAILGDAEGLKEVPDDRPFSGWKNAEVPVAKGLNYGFVIVDTGRHVEHGDRIWEMDGTMRTHIPSAYAFHYTHGRGLKIVTNGDLGRARREIEKWDWILAVGNDAVVASALALAEKELQERHDYIGFQDSHGLLVLSAIRNLGMDWCPEKGKNRRLDRLVERLEGEAVDLGIVPVTAQKLGWDETRGGRSCYQDLEEERIARRIGILDLQFERTKARVMKGLTEVSDGSVRRDQQEYNVSLTSGNYPEYLNTAVDNILTNYLGIVKK